MEGQELRKVLAQQAYDEAKDKNASEKTIYVSEEIFIACLTDKNPHHKSCIIGKGFLRTYHEVFWTENKNGLGRTYNHGIVHIVNTDSEANKTYEIKNAKPSQINNIIGVKRHRLVKIELDFCDNHIYTFTPQRNNFDD